MKTELSDYDLAERLLDLALGQGAEAAEVLQSQSYSRPVYFEANRLKQLESSSSRGTGLRLWKDGRPGLAVAYGDVEPAAVVEKAMATSALNQPETIELAEGGTHRYADLGHEVAVHDLITAGQDMIDRICSAYPEVLCEVELECDVETTRILNSRGLDRSYIDTTLGSYVNVEWVRGDDFLSIGDGLTSRDTLSLKPLVKRIFQRLEWANQNARIDSGRLPVLFTAKAADMLWRTVQGALSGKRAVEGSSPWSDALGESVCAAAVTLYQDPDAGPFNCPFDDEGTETQRLTFIENGVLKLFYCDRTVGRKLGGASTGNGFRPGLGSYPTPSLYNTLIRPGQRSFEDLVRSIDRGVIVDQILGGGAGISGDFSINIDLGYSIHQGELVGRLKDTMVAGNVYKSLNGAIELGNDVLWNGPCYTPCLLLEGLSVVQDTSG